MKKPSRKKPKLKRSRKAQPAARGRAPTPRSSATAAFDVSALGAAFGFTPRASAAGWPSSRDPEKSRPGAPRAAALASRDDRETMALLVLPFVIVALAVAIGQSMRPGTRLGDIARQTPPLASRPSAAPRSEPAPSTVASLRGAPPALPVGPPLVVPPGPVAVPPSPLAALANIRPDLGPPALFVPRLRLDAHALASTPRIVADAAAIPTAAVPALRGPPDLALAAPEFRVAGARPRLAGVAPSVAPDIASAVRGAQRLHFPDAAPPVPRPELALPGHPALASRSDAPGSRAAVGQCVAEARAAHSSIPPPQSRGATAQGFGQRLAAAALAQTRDFVIYNDKYRRIAYPMGDVPALYGVCTDVVIRAYRALGIDLQARVQAARVGSGDTSIDHRRVETLRRFFAVAGRTLPVTDFAEAYQPGDIVTYHRPQNSHSRAHIAVVADVIGPSGRPMIIHNRGWGPQIEDALFVDRITGHYRFGAGDERPAGRVAALLPHAVPPIQPKAVSHVQAPRAIPSARSALVRSDTSAR